MIIDLLACVMPKKSPKQTHKPAWTWNYNVATCTIWCDDMGQESFESSNAYVLTTMENDWCWEPVSNLQSSP